MSKEEILKFNESVLSVLTLIQRDLEKDKEAAEAVQLPADWPATQAILRAVAEDLMLSASVDEAMHRLRRDQKAALTAVLVARKLTPENARKLVRLAHAKAPADFSTLPCLPLATFLIEICDSLVLTKPD
jgi:hypothetical protein